MSETPKPRLESLVDVWDECVRRFPKKTAVIAGGEGHSYADLDRRVRSLAGVLAGRFGVGKGDRIGIMMRNSLEFLISYWAAHRAGAVVSAVSMRLAQREATYVVRTSGARVLLRDAGLEKLVGEAPDLDNVIDTGDVLALADSGTEPPPDPGTAGDDIAVLAHTSGTTGEPKITEVTHADLLFNLRIACLAHSLRHEDVVLVGVPMFHCTPLYSLMPAAAYLGATLVVTPETKPAPLAETARDAGATVWFSVPTLYHQLAVLKSIDDSVLESVRLLAYAGSPMRPVTIRRLRERFPRVGLHNFFGLTETISMTHVLPSPDALSRADSIGKLLPEVHARIVDDDGNDVAPGEVGTLLFHRSNVVRAYWAKPGLLDKAFRGEWFDTGDLAMRDEDGYFYVRGRSKDMIITAGENVYAEEVEGVLAWHPDVRDVAVVGVPATGVRSALGELVKAFIVPAPDAMPTAAAIKRFAGQHLTSYKVPQVVEFIDELPRNASGKVLKDSLREPEPEE
ncbi:MAG: class I adenylate-forming enzyme family protein [Planctomycetota bacterium]|jgi:acyl-CoA synthetase (AMP-forming)/AMP-acid ligase II